jgi:hypothetical protein
MTLHPIEEATIRAFVIPAKCDRMLMLLGSEQRRKDALETLNHFSHWRASCVQELPSSADVLAALRQAGAPSECHVISDSRILDGRTMPLAEAVGAAELYSFASILCCIPGTLACFFDEIAAPRNRFLLRPPR